MPVRLTIGSPARRAHSLARGQRPALSLPRGLLGFGLFRLAGDRSVRDHRDRDQGDQGPGKDDAKFVAMGRRISRGFKPRCSGGGSRMLWIPKGMLGFVRRGQPGASSGSFGAMIEGLPWVRLVGVVTLGLGFVRRGSRGRWLRFSPARGSPRPEFLGGFLVRTDPSGKMAGRIARHRPLTSVDRPRAILDGGPRAVATR